MTYSRPEIFTSDHDRSGFDCGDDGLNRFLTERALRNQASGASLTFVTTARGRVVAYYTLSNFGIRRGAAPGRVARNMPDPIPAVLLGRLAVDLAHQNAGLGSQLLRDAMRRVAEVAERYSAVRALVVHTLDDRARDFYLSRGFEALEAGGHELALLVRDIRRTLDLGP